MLRIPPTIPDWMVALLAYALHVIILVYFVVDRVITNAPHATLIRSSSLSLSQVWKDFCAFIFPSGN